MENPSLRELDHRNIWHPYASPGVRNRLVTKTDGVFLTLEDGSTVIDAMSSWWSAIHGHGHPRLNAAAKQALALAIIYATVLLLQLWAG